MIIFNRIRFCILGLLLGGTLSAVEVGEKIWEFDIKRDLYYENKSSPAIGSDGTVYFGAHGNKLFAFDGQTGVKKWEFETGFGPEFGESAIFGPTIGPDGTVYLVSMDSKIYALDGQTGVKKWEFEMEGDVTFYPDGDNSPALGADGTVYASSPVSANKIYALDGQTGVKKWEFETEVSDGVYYAFGHSSPAIGSDGTVYVGADDNKVYALDGQTGVKKWEFETGGDVRSSPSIGSDGTVYVGSDDGKLYALDGENGTRKWEFETGVWTDELSVFTATESSYSGVQSSPAIGSDGTVYFGARDKFVYALDGQTGEKLWEFETGVWTEGDKRSAGVESSAAIGSDGTIYVAARDGKLYALDASNTQPFYRNGVLHSEPILKWEFEIGPYPESPLLASDGMVYITSGDKVYAVKGSSGPDTNAPWPMLGQNAQRTGMVPASPSATITLPSWSWLETYPWIYNYGTWYYMKPIGSQNYLYNYTTQEWKLMGE